MTPLDIAPPTTGEHLGAPPARLTLVALSVVVLVLFGVMLATSHHIAYDTATADIESSYDYSEGARQFLAYSGLVFCASVLFMGAAVWRTVARSRSWFADAAFLGAAGLAATMASWVVIDAALWQAVRTGNDAVMRTLAVISDAAFLPLMASMMALYIGIGLAGLTTGSLPKWLAVASVVVGAMAALGPAGFVPFAMLPLWFVAVAVFVRLTDPPRTEATS